MGLQNLSDELLLEIVKFVKVGGRNKDLSQLALCSQRLNGITTPLLYRDIFQTEPQALPSLLRTILNKPHLGDYVVTYEATEFENVQLDIFGFTEEDLNSCKDSISRTTTSEDESFSWFCRAEEGEWQALTTILLLNLPNLKAFNIASYNNFRLEVVDGIDPGAIGSLFGKAAALQNSGDKSLGALNSLEMVSVAYADTEMGLSFEDVIPFLKLPSVKTFKVYMLDGIADVESMPGNEFNTRKLELGYSSIEPDAFTQFLPCFASLEILSYQHAGAIVGCSEFLPRSFGAGIQHLKHCLKSLEIFGTPEYTDDERALGIGSLRAFESLVSISTEQKILLGPDLVLDQESEDDEEPVHLLDVVPKSLVRLRLRQCRLGIMDEFEGVLEQKDRATPNLEHVAFRFIGSPPDASMAMIVRDQAEANGISMILGN
ncbi:hypothetical protein DL98DRAFT_580521 [Cadophora sp. DSE1049]|nr:hypothetical protein DL98DRAFT_580521 [Cadophora sp. DSE1049]